MKHIWTTALKLMRSVAPLAGAWIETQLNNVNYIFIFLVAPLAGAWIETPITPQRKILQSVAPLAGAWIETNFFAVWKL